MKFRSVVLTCLLISITGSSFGQAVSVSDPVLRADALLASIETKSSEKSEIIRINEKPIMGVAERAFPMVSSVNIQLITASKSEKIDLNFPRPTNALTTVEILSPAGETIFKFMLPPSNKSHILHLHNLKLENGNYDVNILNDVVNKTHLLQVEN